MGIREPDQLHAMAVAGSHGPPALKCSPVNEVPCSPPRGSERAIDRFWAAGWKERGGGAGEQDAARGCEWYPAGNRGRWEKVML
ncbi:hypothetical protein NDU88_000769 [Pleurodeles waltl]|uniref:Uncharacterized protein n=1 Tax=Pleurodeles waltl TaxID=8319 RepID=A0AAV7KQA5_PLEWA|nr:hypothetical protein NDU88_000769 [Pleurodeles waltl]